MTLEVICVDRRSFLKAAGLAYVATRFRVPDAFAEPYRAFTDDSYWNTPAPDEVDPQSDAWIGWLQLHEDGMGLGMGDWALPDYVSRASDPLATVRDRNGRTVKVHIPASSTMMAGNDKAMNVIDFATGRNVATFETVKVSRTVYTCTAFALYGLGTTGIAEDVVGGTAGNKGHRGIPGAMFAVRLDELAAGVIPHRLKFATSGPGNPPDWGFDGPIWPMDGYEKNHGSGPPEGVVIRLKRSVDLSGLSASVRTIATCLQDYGAILGDTGGHSTIKMAQGSYPSDLRSSSLKQFAWDQWEFAPAGWGKP